MFLKNEYFHISYNNSHIKYPFISKNKKLSSIKILNLPLQ